MTGRPAMGRELTGDQGLGNRAANHAPKRKGAAGKPSTPSCFFGPEEAGKKLTSWLLPARPWRRRRLPGQRRQLRPPCRWRWRSEERRVGTGWVSTSRSRWSPYQSEQTEPGRIPSGQIHDTKYITIYK